MIEAPGQEPFSCYSSTPCCSFLPIALSPLTRSCSRSGGGGGKSGSWGWKASLTLATAPRIRYPESRKLFCRPKHKTASLSVGQVSALEHCVQQKNRFPLTKAGCEAASKHHRQGLRGREVRARQLPWATESGASQTSCSL